MFRRKDEPTTFDAAAPASQANGSTHGSNGAYTSSESSAAPASASSSNASSPVASTYTAPVQASFNTTPAAPRPVSEPARVAPASVPSYRPSPLQDFSRTAAVARSQEPSSSARPAAQSSAQPSSSFSASSEKSASIKPNRRVLTVGNDILLKGEIATCDRLVIEGRVEAKLSEVHTVEIAECGSFKGTAEVEDAEISGVFEGDLVVRNRLVIYATGEVRGNIGYGEIEIERGGRLTGQIKTVTAGAQSKSKLPEMASATDIKARVKESVAA